MKGNKEIAFNYSISISSTILTPSVGSPGNDQASNNSSGFKGLTGGMRQCDGPFSWEGVGGFWWSSTEYSDLDAFFSFLYFSDSTMRIWPYNKGDGMSVRCVKD